MFQRYPTYPQFRTLLRTLPRQTGEDVYALQIGINYVLQNARFIPLEPDGVLGPKTGKAILRVQRKLRLARDGKAGGLTQRGIAFNIGVDTRKEHGVAIGLLHGQLEHESGFRLGIYSKPLRDDPRVTSGPPALRGKSFDAGVTQRNSAFHPLVDAFDPVKSIGLLASTVARQHARMVGIRTGERRRWGLAAGYWNAPAFASWIARQEGATAIPVNETREPGPESRTKIEEYIASVTSHLRV